MNMGRRLSRAELQNLKESVDCVMNEKFSKNQMLKYQNSKQSARIQSKTPQGYLAAELEANNYQKQSIFEVQTLLKKEINKNGKESAEASGFIDKQKNQPSAVYDFQWELSSVEEENQGELSKHMKRTKQENFNRKQGFFSPKGQNLEIIASMKSVFETSPQYAMKKLKKSPKTDNLLIDDGIIDIPLCIANKSSEKKIKTQKKSLSPKIDKKIKVDTPLVQHKNKYPCRKLQEFYISKYKYDQSEKNEQQKNDLMKKYELLDKRLDLLKDKFISQKKNTKRRQTVTTVFLFHEWCYRTKGEAELIKINSKFIPNKYKILNVPKTYQYTLTDES